MTTAILSDDERLERLAREIRLQAEQGEERLCMERLLHLAPWCRRQTERLFRGRFLTSPTRYFRDCQWDIAEHLLKSGENVLEASSQSGFASAGRLHDAVVQRRGMTPGEVRRRGAGVQIRFGLCALRLCQFHGAQEQLTEMAQDFPQAEQAEDAPAVQPYADQLVAFLDARTDIFNPPLDILFGTTFQREVWTALQKVPPGRTVSYTELAVQVGRPSAVRAVACACARNHLAIAIPCHRAVRQDGSLAGFRWGVEWKQRLLALEVRMKPQGS